MDDVLPGHASMKPLYFKQGLVRSRRDTVDGSWLRDNSPPAHPTMLSSSH